MRVRMFPHCLRVRRNQPMRAECWFEVLEALKMLRQDGGPYPEYDIGFYGEGYSVFRYSIMEAAAGHKEQRLAAYTSALQSTLHRNGIAVVVTFDGGGSSIDGTRSTARATRLPYASLHIEAYVGLCNPSCACVWFCGFCCAPPAI